MKMQFIPLDYEAFDFNDKNFIRIIGRNDKGKRICLIDKFEGYFWAILKEDVSESKIKELIAKIKEIEVEKGQRKTKVEKIEVCDKKYLGKKVKAIKVFVTNFKDAHDVADKMDFLEIEKRREYDISIITRYIMDKKILPLNWYEIEGELDVHDINADICLKLEKVKKINDIEFSPKILAYDIEASEFEIGKGQVLMISLYGKNFKKVLTWNKCSKKQDYVECFKDEGEMLEAFIKNVREYEPDILMGYFSDGFDLPYLRARADKHKIKLSLGLDDSNVSFSRGRILSGKISGIVHVDLFRFIETAYSQYLQSETLSLDEVASELLKEGKKEFDFAKLNKMNEDDWEQFFEYNLHDSYLTFSLGEKIWPDMLEFSRTIQEPLYDVTRDGMSSNVENYILHNLEKFNEIAEKRPIHDEIEKRRKLPKYEGAFVFQPIPGLYEDIAFFDFTSMYSSVIVSYNLSLQGLTEKNKDSLEVDLGKEGKAYFSKEKGFFGEILEDIIHKRKEYKKEYAKNPSNLLKARSNAFKLIANASYGYLGFFGARYYCRQAAASAAALARKSIIETIDKIKEDGHKVIYSDTDSVAFLYDNKEKTLELLKKINKSLPGIMELDLEDFYKRGLFVSKRKKTEEESGAKKKYALVNEQGKIKIRGFETVRRDWCDLARKLQSEILELILKEGNEKKALEIAKDIIIKIKTRKIDKKDILIKTQLKKPISEYKAITPHVIAAQKMLDQGMPVSQGAVIEYFIAETREKKTLVREKVKLPDEKGEYNIEYYLNNQILPAIGNIFDVFGVNIEDVSAGSSQKTLF